MIVPIMGSHKIVSIPRGSSIGRDSRHIEIRMSPGLSSPYYPALYFYDNSEIPFGMSEHRLTLISLDVERGSGSYEQSLLRWNKGPLGQGHHVARLNAGETYQLISFGKAGVLF